MKTVSKIIYFFGLLLFSNIVFSQDITLLFPDDNEELTDIAVSFKAKITVDGPFVLHVSRNIDFSGTVMTHVPVENNKGETKDDKNIVYFLTLQGKLNPLKKFVLDSGVWYWRISANNGTVFSETRKLTVNNLKTSKLPQRIISPEKPLFHVRLRSRPFDYPNPEARLAKIVPDALKDIIVIDIGHSFDFLPNDRSLYEYSKLFNDAGYKFFFDSGVNSRLGRIASLGEMEKIFRELPNCVGASTTEMNYYYNRFEEDNSLIYGTLELCKKYGKHFLLADMNWKWNKWQLFNYQFYDLFINENYKEYFIPLFKTTDPWGAYTCVSSIQGMKLAGMANDIGIWSDMWCWEKFGQVNSLALKDWLSGSHDPNGGQKLFPYIQNIKQYIYGITYGSTVFGLEPNLQGHWQTGEPNDHFYRYLLPFIKAVVEENIIPKEKAITDNFNIIVDTEYTSDNLNDTEPLTYRVGNIWGDFLRNTYGISNITGYNEVVNNTAGDIIQAAYLEMIPNTDRYPSGIPFLPKPSVSAPLVNGKTLEVVKVSDLNTPSEVNSKLNIYYPESTNEAYAKKIDNSFFVFNTIENHDIKQSYNLDLNFAGIESLSGDIDLMSYIVGRTRPDKKTLFFQCNAYVKNPDNLVGGRYNLPTYPTKMNFKCNVKPVIQSDEISAITSNWNSTTKIFTVEVDHQTAGAVNFTLLGDDSSLSVKPIVSTANGKISVFGVGKNAVFSMYSLTGAKIIDNINHQPLNINRLNLKTGIHILKIKDDNTVYFKKILIQ
ncbi:T9SS type A sorting domain-containing protein [Flavivirga abyssicola]|uniref:T9SS type A sorting domain-containing protein n=1 Tax=Flavivirga abyssicola TaxID=3063533 RepID=UPI0026E04217|nr:T9SS type A sorting domain-containing protein [Flavivirga sp. MEBiC07777]WVK13905.1 T9SS type A sorting domain-containing protein [Flavivirga sp. MEBiC07777]